MPERDVNLAKKRMKAQQVSVEFTIQSTIYIQDLRRLAEARNEDIQEEFKHENEESFTVSMQSFSSSANEDASDEEVLEKKPPAAFSSSLALGISESIGSKLMRLAGYKGPGTGLGRSEQGIVAPIDAQPTRGKLGLGHDAQKVLFYTGLRNYRYFLDNGH